MRQVHCGTCGGIIADVSIASYQLPDTPSSAAVEHDQPCRCTSPVVHGPPAGYMSVPSMPSVTRPGSKPGAGAGKRPDPSR